MRCDARSTEVEDDVGVRQIQSGQIGKNWKIGNFDTMSF